MWELQDADDEVFIVTFSEWFAYLSIFLVLLCCNLPFLAACYAMVGYHIVFQEDDTDAIMQREQDVVTVDVGLYSLMERFDYEVSDVKMMNLVKEVVIDPILPSSYALLDSYSKSLLLNLQQIDGIPHGGIVKDTLKLSDFGNDVGPSQMRDFLKFQVKFTDKFYEMANSSTWVENLRFLKYKSHQTIVNEYLQTSFFRYGLYSNTEFDIEANLLDYNIWALHYPDYAMLSDNLQGSLMEENNIDGRIWNDKNI